MDPTQYESQKKRTVRHLLVVIGVGVLVIALGAAIGFFGGMVTTRLNQERSVKDELITQNTRLKVSMTDGVVSSQAVAKTASTDAVKIRLVVAPDSKTYCIEAQSTHEKADAVRYHMNKDTPELSPVEGLCGENATEKPSVPTEFIIGAAGQSTASFMWSPIPEARSYELQCSVLDNFSSPLKKTVHEPFGTVEGLTSGIKYSCRVMAENNIGKSGWADPINATTQAQTAVPKSLKIVTVSSTSLSYSWLAVADAKQYVLEYSTDPSFVDDVKKVVGLQTQGTLTGLETNKGYFFHVKVITDSVNEQLAPFSEVIQGRTAK